MSSPVARLWRDVVQQDPSRLAAVDAGTGRVWTRADLQAEADAIRQGFPAGADLSGRRVVFAGANGGRWLAAFLALREAGAVPAAVDPSEALESRRSIAAHIGAPWEWNGDQLALLDVRAAPRRPGAALIKLTSGSTGRPNALLFTEEQMIADARQVCASMQIGPADRNLVVIPFGHSYALGNVVYPLFLYGTAAIAVPAPLPRLLGAAADQWNATVFPAVPALLRVLAGADLEAPSFRSLRTVISAGAPLAATIAQAFEQRFGLPVHAFYGSSETGGITYDRDGAATRAGRSVGTPLEGVTLSFARSGRFTVSSAAVMKSGVFSPADRGAWNEHGELTLLGRIGRTAKVAGRRLNLGEVESALRAVAGVRDCVVVPDPRRGETLAAMVATELSVAELRRLLGERLASWKIPDRWLTAPDLPRTDRGKADRRRVTEHLA